MAKRRVTISVEESLRDEFKEWAANQGLTMSEIIERFMADLCDSKLSGGNDEWYLASEWFRRNHFYWDKE